MTTMGGSLPRSWNHDIVLRAVPASIFENIFSILPFSVSVTYCTTGPDTGKITKLVTDMVMDREFGNTRGFSGLPAAAIVAGDESSFDSTPPLVALERLLFQKKPKQIMEDESVLDSYAPPFPKSVLLQLAEGVVDSNFGLDDNNLLSRDFTYIEPLLGPLSKEQ